MIQFHNRLRELRHSRALSQQKLADYMGTSKSSINMYERGEREPGLEMLEAFADFFNVDLDYIIGKTDVPNKILHSKKDVINNHNVYSSKISTGVRIPVLGKVQAGIPVEAIEEILDYEEIPETMSKQGEFFGLNVRGDSMFPHMVEGDVVIVRKQPDCNSGDIAVILVNGNDATVKKIKKTPNGMTLIPLNPNYDYLFYSAADVENLPVRIIGKVVELRRKF